nr:RagB/SusD family nutrient uptake outer membrane protein [Niabella ginsengisoli]
MTAGYSIYKYPDVSDPYNKIFAQYSYANNPEIILWRQYSADLSLGSAFSRYFAQNLRHQSGISRNLVDEYLCTDGLPISQSPLFNADDRGIITKEFVNRDPRLSQTVAQYGTYQNVSDVMGSNNAPKPNIPGLSGNKCPTGYRMAKWFLNDPADWARVANGMQATPVFRYAETLLIYAEAKAELGECDQTVLDNTINKIRDRVSMPHLLSNAIPQDPELDAAYQKYCDYTPSALLREIRRERRIEMAAEDVRWDDLMRWKAGSFLNIPVLGMKFVQSEYPTLKPGQGIFLNEEGYIEPYQKTLPGRNRVFNDRQYYFPIPLEDLLLNPALEQNPGWPSK